MRTNHKTPSPKAMPLCHFERTEVPLCHFERSEAQSRNLSSSSHRFLHSLRSVGMTTKAVIAVAAILLPSCTARFEELNTNPNQVTAGQM